MGLFRPNLRLTIVALTIEMRKFEAVGARLVADEVCKELTTTAPTKGAVVGLIHLEDKG